MSATVPTQEAFDALEARVKALEAGQAPTPPNPQPPDPDPGPEPPQPPSEGGRPTNPRAPALVAKPAAMPGTSGRVLTVGPGQQHATVAAAMAAAADGDTLMLAKNTPRETFGVEKNLLIDGDGLTWDFNGFPAGNFVYRGKSAIVAVAPATHFRNMTVMGAGYAERTHSLICAIRASGSGGYVVIERCTFMRNQNGVGADGGQPWHIELIEVALHGNGLNDGLTHNLYVNDIHTLILTRVESVDPRGGHAIKSRAYHTFAEGGVFQARATPIDMPNGGVFQIKGTTLRKSAGTDNRRFLSYAVENQNGGTFDVNTVEGALMDLTAVNNPFVQTNGGTIRFDGACRWNVSGKAEKQGAGNVTGLP